MSAGKILVVDDDPQIRRVMKATLVGHNYEVVEARTGEDALETMPRESPNLILLDMNMPGMGGLETCRAIRTGSDTPVIILSVRNTEKDKVAALDQKLKSLGHNAAREFNERLIERMRTPSD